MTFAFYLAAAVALVATTLVITRLNLIHALLYLIVSQLAIAVAFLCLGAPFAAALEVILYAGAILVLFVFVVMTLNLGSAVREESEWLTRQAWIGPAILGLVLLGEVVWLLTAGTGLAGTSTAAEPVGPVAVGRALFGEYVLATELAGMLLLAGLVGAFHLGRRTRPDTGEPPGEGSR